MFGNLSFKERLYSPHAASPYLQGLSRRPQMSAGFLSLGWLGQKGSIEDQPIATPLIGLHLNGPEASAKGKRIRQTASGLDWPQLNQMHFAAHRNLRPPQCLNGTIGQAQRFDRMREDTEKPYTSYEVAVIGGGPAGLTAATYLARFRRSVIVFDGGKARARLIASSHNCPGFPDGISGPELLLRLCQQAEHFRAQLSRLSVEDVRWVRDGFELTTSHQAVHAQRVVLATGLVDEVPAMRQARKAIKKQFMRLCPVCDGFEVMNKRVGVVGPEKTALKEAMFLRTYTSHLTWLIPRGENVSPEARTSAATQGIELLGAVEDLVLDKNGLTIVLTDGGVRSLDVLYAAMGCQVRSELGTRLGAQCDADGYLLVNSHQETSVPGLYAIGDVAKALNQIAVGFGHAALAAADIHNNLPAKAAAAATFGDWRSCP